MTAIFNTAWWKHLKRLMWMAVFAKLLTLPLFILCPNQAPLQKKEHNEYRLIRADYSLSRVMGMKVSSARRSRPAPVKKEKLFDLNTLFLKGIYREPDGGFIVLAEKKNPRKSVILSLFEKYKEYKLIRINRGSAIFERRGKRYVLYLLPPKKKTGKKRTEKFPKITEKPRFSVPMENIKLYMQNPKQIWRSIGIEDIRKNGMLKGFKVTFVKKGSIFDKIGLRKGDIITKVNDKFLKSYGDVYSIYNDMEKNRITTLRLGIVRNKKREELIYDIF